MTVIVAAVTGDTVTMAADGKTLAGWQTLYRNEPKLWVSGQYALGGAGDLRAIQVIRHNVTWPKYRPDEDADLEAFLVKSVVPAVRAGVKDQGIVRTESGVESVARRAAIGSGYAEALGRLGDAGPWTEADVIDAVRRSMQTNNGVGGPISVVNTATLTVRTVEDHDQGGIIE